MALELREQAGGNILIVRASGKLTRDDYDQFGPEVGRLIQQHGKIRMLFDMHDFHGWSVGALWEVVKFDWEHFSDIERLALVGEKKWEEDMAKFCKPFTTAKIQYFDRADAEKAQEWVREDLAEVEKAK